MKKLLDTSQFRKDVAHMIKQGKSIDKLKSVLSLLREETSLPFSLKDHKLTGNWEGCRGLHIAPDWILIYETDATVVTLLRTGSHSEILKR